MKRKFYFHRQNAPLDSDHVIYVLWVGESVKEQRILTQLMSWSFQHGATLRSWSEDIDYYLMIEADRVFPGRGILDFGFVRADINAKDLLFLMQDNSFDAYERSLTVPKAFFQMITYSDRSRIDRAAGEIIPHESQSHPRKNLSDPGDRYPGIISFI